MYISGRNWYFLIYDNCPFLIENVMGQAPLNYFNTILCNSFTPKMLLTYELRAIFDFAKISGFSAESLGSEIRLAYSPWNFLYPFVVSSINDSRSNYSRQYQKPADDTAATIVRAIVASGSLDRVLKLISMYLTRPARHKNETIERPVSATGSDCIDCVYIRSRQCNLDEDFKSPFIHAGRPSEFKLSRGRIDLRRRWRSHRGRAL